MAMMGGWVLPLAVVAQEEAEDDGGGAQISGEAIMAKPGDWEDKEVTVRARVKSAAADEDKDFFQLVFDGGLRCRLAKAPIEAKYMEMKVQCVTSTRGALVRLFHPDVKDARKTLFRAGEEVEVAGTVSGKGSNRIMLTDAKVVRYNWPKVSGRYYDKYGRSHNYGLAEGNPYVGGMTRDDGENGAGKELGQEADIDAATAEAVMAAPADFNGKKIRVQGRIQRLDSDGRDGFLLLLDGNLRCRMRKAEVENQYTGFIYHGWSDNREKSQWQMMVGKDGGAKMVRSERVYGGKSRFQVVIFSKGDEIEITGTVKQASSNRVLLENTSIAAYKWPKAPSGY